MDYSYLIFFGLFLSKCCKAGSVGEVGVWAEAAVFLPENEVIITTDLSAMYPTSPAPLTQDYLMLVKEAYVKFVVGADYNFANGTYLNVQYLHGIHLQQKKLPKKDSFFLKIYLALN